MTIYRLRANGLNLLTEQALNIVDSTCLEHLHTLLSGAVERCGEKYLNLFKLFSLQRSTFSFYHGHQSVPQHFLARGLNNTH